MLPPTFSHSRHWGRCCHVTEFRVIDSEPGRAHSSCTFGHLRPARLMRHQEIHRIVSPVAARADASTGSDPLHTWTIHSRSHTFVPVPSTLAYCVTGLVQALRGGSGRNVKTLLRGTTGVPATSQAGFRSQNCLPHIPAQEPHSPHHLVSPRMTSSTRRTRQVHLPAAHQASPIHSAGSAAVRCRCPSPSVVARAADGRANACRTRRPCFRGSPSSSCWRTSYRVL